MPAISTIIAGVGLGIAAAGATTQLVGSMAQGEAQRKSMQLQRQAEATRQRALDLDSQRKQYSVIREQQLARAQAVANATSQSAQFGSGLQGGEAQISGQAGTNLQGIQQNTEIGNEMFSINQARGRADSQASAAGTISNTGSGVSSLGNTLVRDSGTIARIGGWN